MGARGMSTQTSEDLGGDQAVAGSVPSFASPQGNATNDIPDSVRPESSLCTILVWGSTSLMTLAWFFIVAAACGEKWISYDNKGTIGLRWICQLDVCQHLP